MILKREGCGLCPTIDIKSTRHRELSGTKPVKYGAFAQRAVIDNSKIT